MQGDPAVIAALNAVYGLLLPTIEQAHRQEHACESEGYQEVGDWFDRIERKFFKKPPQLVHYVMNRINALGGRVSARYAFQPDDARPIEQLAEAVSSMVARLYAIRAAYAEVCRATERSTPFEDYVTRAMVWDHLCTIEKFIGKFEDRRSQIDEIGLAEYLAENFDR